MPRQGRVQVESGIYHVVMRGNERKAIFCNEEDKQKVIETVKKIRNDNGFKLYAWCVMDNHIHLLVKEQNDDLARTLKRIGTTYAYYYNKKFQRSGHVFQDRYRSEGIMEGVQLLEVLRYIHNNAVKAGIVKRAAAYQWSSYGLYTETKKLLKDETALKGDIQEVLLMFSSNREEAVKLFKEFTEAVTENKFIDADPAGYKEDGKELEKLLMQLLSAKDEKKEAVKTNKELLVWLVEQLTNISGISGRKIASILGVDRNIVQRILAGESKKNRPH